MSDNYFKEVYKRLKDEMKDIAKEKDPAVRLARYEAFPTRKEDIYGDMALVAAQAEREFRDEVPMMGTFSPYARHLAASETGLTMRDMKYILKVKDMLKEIGDRITKDRHRITISKELSQLPERFKSAAAEETKAAPEAAPAPDADDLRRKVEELEKTVRALTEAKAAPAAAADVAPVKAPEPVAPPQEGVPSGPRRGISNWSQISKLGR